MAEIQGTYDAVFEPLRKKFQEYLDSGEELGASIYVDIDGKPVVDLWGGHVDTQRTRPWTKDTITNVWSSTKTVTNLAALMLVDRGLLRLDEKVATYWPEFAENGKENIEVRHILSHTSGVSGWEKPVSVVDMYDWELATSKLAKQAPWWEPGTASGYHSQDQGHLVGELVRRVTGKSLKQFVAEEVCGVIKADFQIGALESDWARVSDNFLPDDGFDMAFLSTLDADSIPIKTLTGPPPDPLAANTPEWRRADMGAINGHGNARSLARVLSAISLGGEVNGERLLSPETINRIFEEQANGVDLVLCFPLRWGIGYALPNPSVPYIPEGRICFWGGWGGSMIVMDLERRMTIGYVMNKMGPDAFGSRRGESYLKAIYNVVG